MIFKGYLATLASGARVSPGNPTRDLAAVPDPRDHFSNIRIDRIEEARLFKFPVGFDAKCNTSPGRGIEPLVLRNISYTGDGMPSPSVIFGYDSKRACEIFSSTI